MPDQFPIIKSNCPYALLLKYSQNTGFAYHLLLSVNSKLAPTVSPPNRIGSIVTVTISIPDPPPSAPGESFRFYNIPLGTDFDNNDEVRIIRSAMGINDEFGRPIIQFVMHLEVKNAEEAEMNVAMAPIAYNMPYYMLIKRFGEDPEKYFPRVIMPLIGYKYVSDSLTTVNIGNQLYSNYHTVVIEEDMTVVNMEIQNPVAVTSYDSNNINDVYDIELIISGSTASGKKRKGRVKNAHHADQGGD